MNFMTALEFFLSVSIICIASRFATRDESLAAHKRSTPSSSSSLEAAAQHKVADELPINKLLRAAGGSKHKLAAQRAVKQRRQGFHRGRKMVIFSPADHNSSDSRLARHSHANEPSGICRRPAAAATAATAKLERASC